MKTLLWIIEAFICLCIVFFLGVLPRGISLNAGKFFGLLVFLLLKDRRRTAMKNIEIAQNGGLRLTTTALRTVCVHFVNLGRSFAELSMLSMGRDSILKDISFEGIDYYQNAKTKGKGIILITGHCGNWELLALAISWKSFPLSVIARPLNNPYINRLIEKIRTRLGNKVIYKAGAVRKVLITLRNKENIGILIDQSVVEDEAVITEFFGEKVYSLKVPALLAIKTGVPVIPVFINYLGEGRHRVRFGEEIKLRITDNMEEDLVYNTQLFSGYVEKYIKENPTEWLWIHRRWKLSHGRRY